MAGAFRIPRASCTKVTLGSAESPPGFPTLPTLDSKNCLFVLYNPTTTSTIAAMNSEVMVFRRFLSVQIGLARRPVLLSNHMPFRVAILLLWTCFSQGILHARWLGMDQLGTDVFLFESESNSIIRYDISAGASKPRLELPDGHPQMTAACADDGGLLVAYGTSVYRYDLEGGNESLVFQAAAIVEHLLTDGNLLFISERKYNGIFLTCLDRNTLAKLDTWEDTSGTFAAPGISRSTNFLIFNHYGSSYHTVISYGEDGTFNVPALPSNTDSRSTGTWLWPDGSRYMDTTGTVRGTSHPYPVDGSINRAISRAVIVPGRGVVVISGDAVASYSEDFKLVEQIVNTARTPERLAVHDGKLVIFNINGTFTTVTLDALFGPTPASPPDPATLLYLPDRIFRSNSGIIHLFSATHKAIFRWDPSTQSYLGTIPLLGPTVVAYSPAHDAIYTGYGSRVVRRIDASAPEPREDMFGILRNPPLEMVATGIHLFTAADDWSRTPRGEYGYYEILGPDGATTSWDSTMSYQTKFYWNDLQRELYFATQKTTASYLSAYPVTAAGDLDTLNRRGSNWAYQSDNFHYANPVLPSPDGSRLVLGSGLVVARSDLQRLSYGVGQFLDGAWDGDNLVLLNDYGSTAVSVRSGPTLAYAKGEFIPGSPLKVVPLGDGRQFVATNNGGGVSLHILDSNLKVTPPAALDTPAAPTVKLTYNLKLELTWKDVTGEENFRISRRTLPDGTWQTLTTIKGLTYTDNYPASGNVYEYRVTAVNGTLESQPSAPAVFHYGPPPAPVATAVLESATSSRISWQPIPEAASYSVYYAYYAEPGSVWELKRDIPASQTTHLQYNLSPGSTYYFFVRATSPLGISPLSPATAPVTVPQIPPAAPSIQTSGNPEADQVTFSLGWHFRAEGYRLERRNGGTETWATVAETISLYQSQLTDRTVEPLAIYEYRLVGYNSAGNSPPSEVLGITIPDLPLPDGPSYQPAVSGRILPGPAIQLRWFGSRYASGYRIERRTDDSPWELLVETGAGSPQDYQQAWTDTTPAVGIHFTYRIFAFNVKGSVEMGTLRIEAADTLVLLTDDFEPSVDPSVWESLGGATVVEDAPGNHVLRVNGTTTQTAIARNVDLSLGGAIEFKFRGTAGSPVPVQLEIEWMGSWTPILVIDPTMEGFAEWNTYCFEADLNVGGFMPTGRLRFHSLESGPAWEIDDIQVTGVVPREVPAPVSALSVYDFGVVAIGLDPYSTILNWQRIYGATRYVVERRIAGTPWTVVGEGTFPYALEPIHWDSTLPATEYFYRVTAWNPAGPSAPSPELRVVTLSAWQAWRASYYPLPVDAPETEPLADFGTGIPNLLRFAFNIVLPLPPFPSSDSEFTGLPLIARDPTSGRLRVNYVRRKAERQPGIDYIVEFSDDCLTWIPGGREIEVIHGYGMERVICEDDAVPPEGSTYKRFARVRVNLH